MLQRRSAVSLGWIAILLFAGAAAPSARADGTCTAFLVAKLKEAQAKNQIYKIELFIHREDAKLVTYSDGSLAPNQTGASPVTRISFLATD